MQDDGTAAGSVPTERLTLGGRLALLMIPPISGFAQSGLGPIMPRISEAHSADPNAEMLVRLMVTTVSLTMVVGSLGGGMLAHRLGQRPVLLGSLLLFAVSGCLGYFVDDLGLVLAGRLVLGAVNAAAGVMAAAYLTTWVPPEERNRWLGYLMVSGVFGAIAMMMIGGAIGRADWRLVFLLHGVALVPLLLLSVLLPRSALPADTKEESAPAGDGRFPVGLTLLGIACGAAVSTSIIFMPFHLADIGERSPERVALALLPQGLAAGVVSIFYARLRKHLGLIEMFAGGFVLIGVGTAMTVLTTSYAVLIAGMVVLGAGIGFISPNLFAAAAAAARPENRARVLGIVRAGFFGGPLLAQLALEPVSNSHGAGGALFCVAVFAGAMTVVVVAARRALSGQSVPGTA